MKFLARHSHQSLLVTLFLLLLTFPASLHAQDIGNVGLRNTLQTVFSGQTTAAVTPNAVTFPCTPTNGSPCGIQNLGQNVHLLTITVTGTLPCNVRFRLEGSDDGTTFFAISEDGTDTPVASPPSQGGGVYAVGSYAVVRANLVALNAACSVTANYKGSFATTPLPIASFSASQGTRKIAFLNQSIATAGTFSTTLRTPYGSTSGRLLVDLSGTTGVTQIKVALSPTYLAGGGTGGLAFTQIWTTILGDYLLDIPSWSASYILVSISTTGNCTAGPPCNLAVFYQFDPSPTQVTAVSTITRNTANNQSSSIVNASLTNPVANAQLLNFNDAGGNGIHAYPQQLTLSASAAAQINVILTSSSGATCTTLTPSGLAVNGSPPVIQSTTTNGCTTPPTTVRNLFSVFVPANDVRVVDLSSLIIKAGGANGISAQVAAAVTGTVTASLSWYEN